MKSKFIKLCLAAVLIICIMMSAVLPAAADDNISVNEILSLSVTNLPFELVEGQTTAETVRVSTLPSANITVDSVSWTPNDAVYLRNTSYTVSVMVSCDEAVFSSSLDAYVNDYSVTPVFYDDGAVEVSYTYSIDDVTAGEEPPVLTNQSLNLSVDKTSLSLNEIEPISLDETAVLVAEFIDADGNVNLSKELVWEISDEDILRLEEIDSQTMTVVPIKAGEAVVTVSSGGVSDSADIVVYEPEPVMMMASAGSSSYKSIEVYGNFNITMKTTGNANANLRLDDGTYVSGFTWSVADESVIGLSIYNYGKAVTIIPRNIGETDITVTSVQYPDLNKTVHVVVEETKITSISLSSSQSVSLGTTGSIWAHAYDQFGHWISSEGLDWRILEGDALTLTMSNEEYRAIVTPVREGTSVIQVTSESNKSVSSNITVNVIAGGNNPGIDINSYSGYGGYWYWVDDCINLSDEALGKIYANFYNGDLVDDASFVWDVEDESIISLTEDADYNNPSSHVTLTPLKTGFTDVTCSLETNSCINKTLRVYVDETVISSFKFSDLHSQMSLKGDNYGWIYILDQFGNCLPEEKISLSAGENLQLSKTSAENGDHVSVTPKSVGKDVIIVTSETKTSVSKSYPIEIFDTIIGYMTIETNDVSLESTDVQAYVNIYDQFGQRIILDESVEWTSSNENILKINPQSYNARYAQLIPVSLGKTTITAKSLSDSNVKISRDITVEETKLSSIYLWSSSTISTKSTGHANAYVRDQFGNRLPNEIIKWSVSDPSVISLSSTQTRGDNSITLTPQKAGTVTLRAESVTNPELYKETKITVEDSKITSVYLSSSSTISTKSTSNAHAYVCDQFGNSLYDESIKWYISDSSVISLSSTQTKGSSSITLTPQKAGIVTLRAESATDSSIYLEQEITVEETKITSVDLSSSSKISTKSTGYANGYVRDQFGNTLPNEIVKWSVSDPSVVSLSNTQTQGSWGITLYPKKAGTVTIRAESASNPEIYLEQKITVAEAILTEIYISGRDELSLDAVGYANAYLRDQFGNSINSEGVRWSIIKGTDVINCEVYPYNDNGINIYPKAIGEAVLRVSSVTNLNLYKDITISVEKTELSEFRISCPEELTLQQTRSAYAELRDQFDNYIDGAKITWSIAKGSGVIELQPRNYDSRYVNIIPKSLGTAVIRASVLNNNELYKEVIVNVVAAQPSSMQISGSSYMALSETGYADVYVYDQFRNYMNNEEVLWSIINETGKAELEIIDKSDYQLRNLGDVMIKPKAVGTVILRAESVTNKTLYDELRINILERVPITAEFASDIIAKGDKMKISGQVEGNPSRIMYYVFGTNYFNYNTIVPEKDGNYSTEIETGDLATGQYFVIVQHPMFDNLFNVMPGSYTSQDSYLVINTGTLASFRMNNNKYDIYSFGTINDTSGIKLVYRDYISGINTRHTANAAQAVCDLIDEEYVDDIYVRLDFVVPNAYVTINAIADQTPGSTFMVSGTTNVEIGEIVTIDIISTKFQAEPKASVSESSYIFKSSEVIAGQNGVNIYSVTFDSVPLAVDAYTAVTTILRSTAQEDLKVSTTFNIVQSTESSQYITVNPIGNVKQNSNLTIAGTTKAGVGEDVSIEIISSKLMSSKKESLPESSHIITSAKVNAGSNGVNTYTVTINETKLALDEYTVNASSGSHSVLKIFNIVDESGVPVTPTPVVNNNFSIKSSETSYYIGENITVHGINTLTENVYLYIKGANKPLQEIPLYDGEFSGNRILEPVTVLEDNTWKVSFELANKFDSGTYTIYAVEKPYTVVNHMVQITEPEKLYTKALTAITLKQPYMTAKAENESLEIGQYINISGEAAGNPGTLGYYIFGTNCYSYEKIPLNNDGTYSLKVDTKNFTAGQYFVIIQHPMYDKLFNVAPMESNINTIQVFATTQDGGLIYRDQISDINMRQPANVAQIVCDLINEDYVDDTYVKLTFYVSVDPEDVPKPNDSLTAVAESKNVDIGKNISITGFAADKPQRLNCYIFGNYEYVCEKITPGADGNYSIDIPTDKLSSGNYYIMIQHPMENGYFNVQPSENEPNTIISGTNYSEGIIEVHDRIHLSNYGPSWYPVPAENQIPNYVKSVQSLFEEYYVDDVYVLCDVVVSIPIPTQEPTTPPSITVPSPSITSTAVNGIFSDSCNITITSDYENSVIYYTLDGTKPTNASSKYLSPITITDTAKVSAVAAVGNDTSSVTTASFTKFKPEEEYTITLQQAKEGGTISVDKTKAKAEELITVTLTAYDGYKTAGYTIYGETNGLVNKSSDISKFAMWSEDIVIFANFAKDDTPKASSIIVSRIPGNLYTAQKAQDTGTLTAAVKDQFGKDFKDTVTWKTSDSSVVEINAVSGAYKAKSTGQAVITAVSKSNANVTKDVILTVYYPPRPQINGEIDNGNKDTVEFGVESDAFVVDSTNTLYLNWDWGDGSKVRTPTKHPDISKDSVSHTFIKYGDLNINVVPSNKYLEGDAKVFTIKVIHAKPTNLVIENGPKSVTAGDTKTYKASATNAKSYVWYLGDNEVSGQTGSTAEITFPESMSGEVDVKVKAYNGYDSYSEIVTKKVHVAQRNAPLGTIGGLTIKPSIPVVNELANFGINAVDNAVRYKWTFAGGYEETTTAPAVSYALLNTDAKSVKVTAYNSTGASVSKEFTISQIGQRPTVSLTPETSTAHAYESTTFTASSIAGVEYTWYLDGNKIAGAAGSTYTKDWKYDDIGSHSISVTVDNAFGTASAAASAEITPKEGTKPIIHKVNGKSIVKQGSNEKYHVIVKSADAYNITWYLNGELVKTGSGSDSDSKFYSRIFSTMGSYTLEVEVTTVEYGETASQIINIEVVDSNKFREAKEPDPKEAQKNPSSPKMNNTDESKNSFERVTGIAFDKNDLNEDGEEVYVNLEVLDSDDLKDFTDDMGSKDDILVGIDIDPVGLKNKKDLNHYAEVIFSIPVADVVDVNKIAFFRYDTGSDINGWESLSIKEKKQEGNFWIFTVLTGGMSQIVGTYSGSEEISTEPVYVQPTTSPNHVSGGQDTGSGNYKEYDRSVTDGGVVTFGTSPVVTSVDLPKGVSGSVVLVAESETPAPDGKKTVKVFEINVQNYPTGEAATITFKLTVEDIEKAGFTPADICLYHCGDNGVWTKLATTYVVKNGIVYYEAVTTDFSPFAIVYEVGSAKADETIVVPKETATAEPEPVVTTATPVKTASTPAPKATASPMGIVGLLAGLGAAGLVIRRK